MASKKILVQLDIQAASSLTSPLSGFVGFSAKADGLYQKIGTSPELRLLTSADVQNAILANGSITGAVSQAQIFTMGVKLYNLTQGYIPYASGATKLLSNSPIYTDGTNVGIGTIPSVPLDINGVARFGSASGGTNNGNIIIAKDDMFPNISFRSGNTIKAQILANVVSGFLYFDTLGSFNIRNAINGGTTVFTVLNNGNAGIGTTSPTASLHIKAGTAIANTAPIKLTSGVNLTTPESGAIEFSSSRLYFTPSTTRETVAFISDITAASHVPVTIGAIGSAPNANGISISGQTLSLQPASANYGGIITTGTQTFSGNKTFNGNINGSGSNLLTNIIIDTHPESSLTTIPFINNDIAYLTLRGGSVTANYGTPSATLFNGAPDYAEYNNTDWATTMPSGYVLEINFHRTFQFGTKVGVSFGAAQWRANYIKLEVYDTGLGAWKTVTETSTNSSQILQASTGGSAPTYGISKARFTFNDFNSYGGSNFRISEIWVLNYSSLGSKEVFVGRDGGAMYGTLNLNKNILTNIGNVGTNFIASTGGLNLAGLLTSNGGISNPSSYTQSGTSLNTFTGISTFSNATYSALFTGGNVGIGTPTPNQQLEITKNFRLPSTTGITPYGIIYKGTTPFIHDFNYGNNGTVTTDGRNTFVGINAGNLTMGSTATQTYFASYNTGIGYQSLLSNTTGCQNTANGYASLYFNTTGNSNTANGYASLYSNTTGSNNTALGYNSGRYIADGTIGRSTGENGLYLGYNSKASADGTDNEIVVGYNAIGAGSNKTVIGNSSVTDTYFGSSTGSSKLWASALNLSGLTASKVVFTDSSKNLTSTGIGTAAQFIKGDGSLDSNTYLTTGTTIISGSGVASHITLWNGVHTQTSNANLTFNSIDNLLSTNSIYLAYNFKLGSSTTAGYVLTTDANGNGTWQAPPTGGGSYTLPTATASVLGGVKIGSGITISSGVISVSTNYQAPITTGTTLQYLRGDLSLATFPTINTGSGFNGGVTFWNGTNSLSSSSSFTWNNVTKELSIIGDLSVSSISVDSLYSPNATLDTLNSDTINTYSIKISTFSIAGHVLTCDGNGNGTWQAPVVANGLYTDAQYNTAGGIRAGLHLLIDAERNTFLGYEAGRENTTGSYNTFLGYEAGLANTSGEDNTAIGSVSLANNTSGYQNTAIGKASLISNLTGYDNTAIGYNSLVANTTGNQNTADGVSALYSNTTGISNAAIGVASLLSNTTGSYNTVCGSRSLYSNITGYNNTALGYNSGSFLADGTTVRTTGNNGLYLGLNSKASANGTDNEIVIGSSAIGNGSNTITLGNDSIIKTILKGRLKLKTVPSVYADNSSAITGGLSAGEIYRTSIGVLMIVY